MEKLIGLKKIKIAVFISGKGSNLLNLIKNLKKKNSKPSIELIFSDNKFARGLQYGKKYNIPVKILNYKKTKFLAEKEALKELNKKEIEIICLAGFMKILSHNFIKKFKGKIINIHPSLLPKYKGLNTHQRAIDNKDKYSGCTVHYVTPKLDSGKIIIQKKVKIYKNDNSKLLGKRVLKQEHVIYPIALKKLISSL